MNEKLNWSGWANQLAAVITFVACCHFFGLWPSKKFILKKRSGFGPKNDTGVPLFFCRFFRILLAIFFIGFFLDRFVSPGARIYHGDCVTGCIILLFKKDPDFLFSAGKPVPGKPE